MIFVGFIACKDPQAAVPTHPGLSLVHGGAIKQYHLISQEPVNGQALNGCIPPFSVRTFDEKTVAGLLHVNAWGGPAYSLHLIPHGLANRGKVASIDRDCLCLRVSQDQVCGAGPGALMLHERHSGAKALPRPDAAKPINKETFPRRPGLPDGVHDLHLRRRGPGEGELSYSHGQAGMLLML